VDKAYIKGITASGNFPQVGSFPCSGLSLSAVFVTKISPLDVLVYSLIFESVPGL
jgi:hypothetical protein